MVLPVLRCLNVFIERDISRALYSFPDKSATGLDGLKPSDLKKIPAGLLLHVFNN